MKRSLLALASGAFALGAAEFVMMGILPQTAAAMRVSIPDAGRFISAYAVGVCVGTLILVFGRTVPPKRLVILFMVLIVVGNAMAAAAPNASMLLLARFISGVPHGAFFGTATIIARAVADRGREARAVAIMVTGQTVANMLGVPAGTLLAEHVSWRAAFTALAVWAAATIVLSLRWIPRIPPIRDAGLGGQFAFLAKPGPWLVLGAVFLGNAGVFCWWSYVAPWLTRVAGYTSDAVPLMMMVAGLGMVVGGLAGGRIADRWRHAATAALGQSVSALGLLLVFLTPGSPAVGAALTFVVSFGLFFISSPQQLLMMEAGRGGGEMLGGAVVQVAFNFGNAVGSVIGGTAITLSSGNYHYPALSGVPLAVVAVVLLVVYSRRYETHIDAAARLRPVNIP